MVFPMPAPEQDEDSWSEVDVYVGDSQVGKLEIGQGMVVHEGGEALFRGLFGG